MTEALGVGARVEALSGVWARSDSGGAAGPLHCDRLVATGGRTQPSWRSCTSAPTSPARAYFG